MFILFEDVEHNVEYNTHKVAGKEYHDNQFECLEALNAADLLKYFVVISVDIIRMWIISYYFIKLPLINNPYLFFKSLCV